MNKSLESLLILACLELEGTSRTVVTDAFSETMSIFLNNLELFEKLPETVIKKSSSLQKQEEQAGSTVGLWKDLASNFGEDIEETLVYFDKKALLIYDGIEASAFGRMSYIYRSKGIRLYLFSSGELSILTPYSYIDHNGFQLKNEILNSFGPDFMEMSIDDVRSIIHYTSEDFNVRDHNQFVCGELLKMLCSVKKQFRKDYYLEYLLTPPDVDKPSVFSSRVKDQLWDICLSDSFREKWGTQFQYASMNILSSIGIPPSSGQLVKFIKSPKNGSIDLSNIMMKLDEIQDNIVRIKESNGVDMLEIKPNFFGVGLNVNEIYKRIKNTMNNP
ncbi:hypothetical protein ACE38U_04920 [Cedecea sp. S5-13]|uniref:hypothetical protein n=1 Tax=Cedecea selenatireducens TaxID=3144416 RepID=UPI0035CCCA27